MVRNISEHLHRLKIVRTPMLEVEPGLFAKLELCQKTGSVKDRFVFLAVKQAVLDGLIHSHTTLVEATSGNTGISLSAAGAALGLDVTIVMPENMSEERKVMMRKFGAKILEVGPSDFHGAIQLRNELVSSSSDYWSPCQFENEFNTLVHANVTAPEINTDMSRLGHSRWHFVSGAGTGGTLMGVHKYMTSQSTEPGDVIQVAPAESAANHGIQGINDGADFLLDTSKMERQVHVSTTEAIRASHDFAKTHGLLVGISAGANLVAARKLLSEGTSAPLVTLLCDRGERYFSIS